jgi:beta-glucosidase
MTETARSPLADPFGALATPESLTDEQIDARARALVARLSLDEKLGLMDGDLSFYHGLAAMMPAGGYASRPWVAGAVPRLGIPGIRFADGPRGVILPGATTFPVSMARGATWDPDLEERIGDAIGRELRALGGNFFGGVCINLLRHPAWGRAQETYGEDTTLLGAFGAALTRGVQRHVMACAKHYALNSMENARFTVDVTIAPRALHEVYLPHFRRCVEAGVASVMTAYNSVNGEWAGQNRVLITDILKRRWGFDGFVISDFLFGIRDAKTAALAGMDIEMPFRWHFARSLKALVERGEVPPSRIDDAALRILRQEVRFAQGRDPGDYSADVVACEAHRALAREAAARSIVLLRNDGAILPLHGVKRLAVVGALAAVPNTGDGGSSNTQPPYVVTPLDGVRAALGADVAVTHDDGSDPARAAAAVRDADAVLLVVGYTHADEGEYIPPDMMESFAPTFPPPSADEQPIATAMRQAAEAGADAHGFPAGGDRERLTLHARDEALIQAVAAANPRTIVAIMAGSAVVTEAWRHRVPAILVLWYPGMEGGNALADVLLGRVNPSGRLPCTFPARAEDLPHFDRSAKAITYDLWHGYRKLARDGAAAAFPFGFGLSYTTFRYANARLASADLSSADTLEVLVDVTNAGSVAGDDVVQLYVAVPRSRVERAPRELKAFARVALAPGESRTVRLALPVAELAFWDETRDEWAVEPTDYHAIVARHAEDPAALQAAFRVRP